MRLLVLGASGKTGREVVAQALSAGHEVTAFVRDPSRLDLHHSRLTVATGDARDAKDLGRALRGQDAVISTLGTRSRHAVLGAATGRSSGMMERSTTALIEAAPRAGVRRVVLLSTFMLAGNFRPGILKPLAAYYKPMNDDKRAGERALKDSSLDWTIVYATRLTNGERSGRERPVAPAEIVTPRNSVSRADVAAFLLAQLNDEKNTRDSVVLTAA